MTSTHTTLDGAALRRAFSDRDGDALTALYADDATIEVADAQNTPSAPLKVEGRDAIRAYFDDILARDMTHEVDTVAITGDSAGFSVRCVYPDGLRVLCVATAQISHGLIVHQLPAQAWGLGRLAGPRPLDERRVPGHGARQAEPPGSRNTHPRAQSRNSRNDPRSSSAGRTTLTLARDDEVRAPGPSAA